MRILLAGLIRLMNGHSQYDRERDDYPLCPYCLKKVVGFGPPHHPEKTSVYCSSGECKGRSVMGIMNGYDILFKDLKSPT